MELKYALPILALLLAAWSVHIARKSYALSKKKADKQKGEKAENIEVSLYKPIENNYNLFPEVLAIFGPIDGAVFTSFPIKFILANSGSTTAENVKVQIQFSSSLRAIPVDKFVDSGALSVHKDIDYEYQDEGGYQIGHLNIGNIDPGVSINLHEAIIFCNPSNLSSKNKINIVISQKDKELINNYFYVIIADPSPPLEMDSDTEVDLTSWDERKKYIEKQISDNLDKCGNFVWILEYSKADVVTEIHRNIQRVKEDRLIAHIGIMNSNGNLDFPSKWKNSPNKSNSR